MAYTALNVTKIEFPNGIVMSQSEGKYVKTVAPIKTTATSLAAGNTGYFKMDAQDWRFVLLVNVKTASTKLTVKAGDNKVWAADDLELSFATTGEYAITLESGKYKNTTNLKQTCSIIG